MQLISPFLSFIKIDFFPAYTKSTKPQYDTSLQHPEAEDKVVPIDLRCELCEIKLSSHGHYLRHLGVSTPSLNLVLQQFHLFQPFFSFVFSLLLFHTLYLGLFLFDVQQK